MPKPTRDDIMAVLRTVNDPELHRDLVSLKMIKNVAIDDGRVNVHVELTTPACPMKDQITRDVTRAIQSLDGVREVHVEFSGQVRADNRPRNILPDVKNIFAVGAGKGGVGKSTVAALLAVGLHRAGATVGLMDADVYGPSIPTMMGVAGAKPAVDGDHILPVDARGIKLMSIGFMIDPDKPLIWRGPMVHGVVKQFLEQVNWGPLDYLVVDLPPGTGDVPLTLAQSLPMTGAVIVCTPQDVALLDARRALMMYRQLNVPCLGIVENMSFYICPHCGHRDEIFDHGGAKRSAEELGVPFLGAIPLNTDVRILIGEGTPEKLFSSAGDAILQAIQNVATATAGQISIRNLQPSAQPTLSIE
ncbi:MAG: Mrp/NBP35 family ATP-binding protein [Phycisphaerales bacterium]|nr:Mrp/NBP35 family ATP-binding protein [Phycisphaerales bacterium]